MSRHALIEATNELFRLGASIQQSSTSEVSRALTLSCRALRSTLGDASMAEALDAVAGVTNSLFPPAAMPHIKEFADTFLATEQMLLLDAGLSDGAVRSLMDAARAVVQELSSPHLDVARLYSNLARLEQRVCGRATQIRDHALREQQSAMKRERIGRVVGGVGGAAIVAVNALAVSGTPVLSPIEAALSASVGSSLIDSALQSAWDSGS